MEIKPTRRRLGVLLDYSGSMRDHLDGAPHNVRRLDGQNALLLALLRALSDEERDDLLLIAHGRARSWVNRSYLFAGVAVVTPETALAPIEPCGNNYEEQAFSKIRETCEIDRSWVVIGDGGFDASCLPADVAYVGLLPHSTMAETFDRRHDWTNPYSLPNAAYYRDRLALRRVLRGALRPRRSRR